MIHWIKADLNNPDTLLNLPKVKYMIFTATPGERSELAYRKTYYEGLKHCIAAIDHATLERIFFVSSTSVYAQQDGSWVNEISLTEPKSFSGKILLEAEQWLLKQPFEATIVRFSGIYGPNRYRLIKKVIQGNCVIQKQPPKYTNRIHRDDCSGIIEHLIKLNETGNIIRNCYLGSDSQPTSEWEILSWIAEHFDRKNIIANNAQVHGNMNKRCDNSLLIESGYKFKYPSYKIGYTGLIKDYLLEF